MHSLSSWIRRTGGRELNITPATLLEIKGVDADRRARFNRLLLQLEEAGAAGATHKIWIASGDERTRSSHSAADGQMVPLDAPFIVGGEALHLPCDPSASFQQTASCRCTVRTVRLRPGAPPAPDAPILSDADDSLGADIGDDLASRRRPPRPPGARLGPGGLRVQEQLGGHTIARHVGQSPAQLRARLEREPALTHASTFLDVPTANLALRRSLRANRSTIDRHFQSGSILPLRIRHKMPYPIGQIMLRNQHEATSGHTAVFWLTPTLRGPYQYRITTGYVEN